MKKNIITISILISLFIIPGSVLADWRFEWKSDTMTDKELCLVFSEKQFYKIGYGKSLSGIYLGIQDNGLVSIHSTKSPFDQTALNVIGLRINDNPSIFGPVVGSNVHTLIFNQVKSAQILAQLATAKTIKLQIVFFPKGDKLIKQYAANGYIPSVTQFNGCKAIKDGSGWVGVYMFEAANTPELIKWVKEHSDYSSPGVMIITVDPRKEAFKMGLKSSDFILAYNKTPATVADLAKVLSSLEPGSSIELEIAREDRVITKTITRPAN